MTKRNAVTQTTMKGTNRRPSSTFGTPKKWQPHLGPDFDVLQSFVKENTQKIDQTS